MQSQREKFKVSIELQEQDRDILEKLSLAVLKDIKLTFIKKRKSTHKNKYRVVFHSKHISNTLYNLGCVNKKSLVLEFPILRKDLEKHFIRGYFDGDGSLYYNKRKNRKSLGYCFSIISTDIFCRSLIKIIEKELDINVLIRSSSCKNEITKILYIKGNIQISKVLDWLYKDATIYLSRKHNKYLEFKQLCNITV